MSYPLTPLQSGMLFHDLLEPNSGVDIEQIVVSLAGPLDVETFARAWQAVAARHDVLRASFRWQGCARPMQDVHPRVDIPFVQQDWRALGEAERTRQLRAYLLDDRRAGFALDAAPLFRLALFRTGLAAYEFVWTIHHAILDGRSFAIVLRDAFAAYDSLRNGEAPFERAGPAPQFDAYVAWLEARDFAAAGPFWRARLQGFRAATPLPLAYVADPARAARGERQRRLDAATTAALERLAARADVTATTLVQGAWALLLARHSGEDEVVFGATRACRRSSIPSADAVAGLFINTLPMRVVVRDEDELVPWLRALRSHWNALREWEHTPLARVQEWSDVERGSPLFESIVVFENRRLESALQSLGGSWAQRRVDLHEQTNYALTLAIYGDEALVLKLQYDGARFDEATIDRILDQLTTLLASLAAAPERATLGSLEWVSARERLALAAESALAPPSQAVIDGRGLTLDLLVARQAARAPNAVALVFGGERMTYAELELRAGRLAHRLRAAGVGPEAAVGVALERSFELVIAILAVLKTGGFYVPLDPSYPRERLRFIIEDAAPAVLLTTRELAPRLPSGGAQTIAIDDAPLDAPLDPAGATIGGYARPEHLAYAIYTSGSTGRPKGVMVTHENVVRLFTATEAEFGFGERDVWTLYHSYAFDFSVWELFGALAYGGTLVIVPYWVTRSPEEFRALLAAERVTVLNQTPSAFFETMRADAEHPEPLPALRLVIFGGESLEPARLEPWYARYGPAGPRLVNGYGITETTVFVTFHGLTPSDAGGPVRSPIGHAIPDLPLYVLDRAGRLVPRGVAGELYVGGDGVARGYLGRPELTAERFLPDPFAGGQARFYRTGDRVRRLPGGDLEYLGRLDHQLKIRGFRIEPGEIEAALRSYPALVEALVIAREGAGGERRLVAYVVAAEPVEVERLRDFLAERLPAHLVPAQFVTLDALPTTPSGKIDRLGLPDPGEARPSRRRSRVAPRTPEEEVLAGIWTSVLQTGDVGVTDDYFELGGDSILTIGIVARAREAGLRITPRQLFDHPTVEALAKVATRENGAAVDQGPVTGTAPLTPIERWFFDAQDDELDRNDQAFLFDVPRDFEAAAFAVALTRIVEHHDALRLRFARADGEWTQRFAPPEGRLTCDSVDLAAVPEAGLGGAIERVCEEAHRSLDIARGPLVRAVHLALGPGRGDRLFLAVHHLAVDGVSWQILVEDLGAAYLAARRGERAVLPRKTTSYRTWAQRLCAYADSPDLRLQAPYWERNAAPARRLPADLPARSEHRVATSATYVVRLQPAETWALVQRVPAAFDAQIGDVLLAALAVALERWLGEGPLRVDLEGHGREDVFADVDLSRTVGWFTTIFPMRLELAGGGVAHAVGRIKEQLRGVPQRGFGYGLLRYLAREPLAPADGADVLFNYLGRFDRVVAGSESFRFASEASGAWRGPRAKRLHAVEINALVLGERLEVRWTYDRTTHLEATIARAAGDFLAALRALVAGCPDAAASGTAGIEDAYPLAPIQQLFYALAGSGNDPGFEQWRYRLRGPVDVPALRQAWQTVVDRHPILRTAFEGADAAARQTVRRHATLPFAVLDWRTLAPEDRARRSRELLRNDREDGFDLARPPLMRVTLVRMSEEAYELVWSQHHLLLDRWSWPLVLKEVAECYAALRERRLPILTDVVPYGAFVRHVARREPAAGEAFWRGAFHGFVPPPGLAASAALAGDAAEPSADAAESLDAALTLGPEETAEVRAFAATAGVSPNVVVAGAWGLWLAHHTAADDLGVGVALAGRPADLPGVERIVGVTIANLPLRLRLAGEAGAVPWLRALAAQLLDVEQFAATPLARVQEWSGVPWRQRLFETLLVFQHASADRETEAWLGPAVHVERLPAPTRTGYPLTLVVGGGDMLSLQVGFNRRFVDAELADSIVTHLRTLLLGMARRPGATLAELQAALPPVERGAARREGAPATRPAYVAPRSALEMVLAGLWTELLGEERVGANDDFFALGGQSLLAMQLASRVRDTFSLELPVRALFAAPTLAEQAELVTAHESRPGQAARVAELVRHVASLSLEELQQAAGARAAPSRP